jgi:hypothetical protein
MKAKPILFSEPMVRAILEGRKTQTRRIMKPQPSAEWNAFDYDDVHRIVDDEPQLEKVIGWGVSNEDGDEAYVSPYGQPGDLLWVREEYYQFGHWEPVLGAKTKTGRQKRKFVVDTNGFLFEAPSECRKGIHHKDPATPAWHKRRARFMPRRASRITIEITNVRVERLQNISEEDARSEGIPNREYCRFPVDSYRELWGNINGVGSWEANPWVWVIEFKHHHMNVDELLRGGAQ